MDKAYIQAPDYFPGIKERDLPKYVLVSDFARFRLYDLEALPSLQPSPRSIPRGNYRYIALAGLIVFHAIGL